MTAQDVTTFGPTLRLLLLEESERQHRIADALEKQSERSAAGHGREYAQVLANLVQLQDGRFQPDLNNKKFFAAVANLLLAEAKRLQNLLQALTTMLPATGVEKALDQFEKYRRFLVEVAMSSWSVD